MKDEQLRVGFVGLGIMGAPMALNCIKAGFPMTVYNRTSAKTDPLKEAGAAVADSPADVARASDVVLMCVTASDDVLSVALDESFAAVIVQNPNDYRVLQRRPYRCRLVVTADFFDRGGAYIGCFGGFTAIGIGRTAAR